MHVFDPARRQVLKGSAAVMAAGALGSLSALQSRQAQAATTPSMRLAPVPSRYGPLAPVADQSTGLPLLQLPRGFQLPLVRLERRPHGRWPTLPRPA